MPSLVHLCVLDCFLVLVLAPHSVRSKCSELTREIKKLPQNNILSPLPGTRCVGVQN